MQRPKLTPLLLTFALATSGCASSGKVACPPPAKLPPVPAELMQEPTYDKQILEVFSESGETALPTSESSNPF